MYFFWCKMQIHNLYQSHRISLIQNEKLIIFSIRCNRNCLKIISPRFSYLFSP